MKNKFQYSNILLLIMPMVILVITMTIDWIEPMTAKYFYRIWKPDLVMWLWSLGRVVFGLVIFAGMLYFINHPRRNKLHCVVWLGLGFLVMFASTAWGHGLHLIPAQASFPQIFPRNLSFLAAVFLFLTGVYGLIKPVNRTK